MTRILVSLIFAGAASTAVGAGMELSFAPSEKGSDRIEASGVRLDSARIATVAVVGADPARAQTKSGEVLKLLAHDRVTRLTILQGPDGGDEPSASSLGNSLNLEPGAALYLPGEKARASRVVRWENSYRGKILPVALIRIHHPSNETPLPGTPLFNGQGEVVAICHQPAPKFGNGTFALPVEVAQRVLADLKAARPVTPCWIGVTVNAINPVLAVEMVRPESPGAKAGVMRGDILLAVGPRQVSTYADARDAFYYLVAGESTGLTLLRGTQRLELQVIPEVHPALTAADE